MNRAIVIINRREGSAEALHDLGDRVGQALRARGLEAEVRTVGDGSIRCAAARAAEIQIPRGRAGLVQLLGELGSGLWGLDDRVEFAKGRAEMIERRVK